MKPPSPEELFFSTKELGRIAEQAYESTDPEAEPAERWEYVAVSVLAAHGRHVLARIDRENRRTTRSMLFTTALFVLVAIALTVLVHLRWGLF